MRRSLASGLELYSSCTALGPRHAACPQPGPGLDSLCSFGDSDAPAAVWRGPSAARALAWPLSVAPGVAGAAGSSSALSTWPILVDDAEEQVSCWLLAKQPGCQSVVFQPMLQTCPTFIRHLARLQ